MQHRGRRAPIGPVVAMLAVLLATGIFLRAGGVLSASSALGAPGVVDVQAQITDASGALESLPESVLPAATLLREARPLRVAQGPSSSFVLAGRGLPPGPGGLLPSPLLESVSAAASLPAASIPAASSFSPVLLTASCR